MTDDLLSFLVDKDQSASHPRRFRFSRRTLFLGVLGLLLVCGLIFLGLHLAAAPISPPDTRVSVKDPQARARKDQPSPRGSPLSERRQDPAGGPTPHASPNAPGTALHELDQEASRLRQRGEYRKAASILGTLYKKTKNKGYQKDITTIKRSSRKHFATGRSLLKRAGSLEKEGRQLEKVRRRSGTSAAALKQCTRASKKLRMRVEKLEVETNSLPPVFGELLAPVLEHLGDCVSCLSTAKESCMAVAANQKKARLELKSQNYP